MLCRSVPSLPTRWCSTLDPKSCPLQSLLRWPLPNPGEVSEVSPEGGISTLAISRSQKVEKEAADDGYTKSGINPSRLRIGADSDHGLGNRSDPRFDDVIQEPL